MRPESDDLVYGIQAHSFANAEWSAPVHLGAVVNSAATDQAPTLSPDGLSLYFGSDRPGGLGGTNLWVSRRACDAGPWEAPVNLGATVNSSAGDAGPSLSIDGHLLFFTSPRPGGHGLGDIYVSRRANPKDDFAWERPVNLGPDVNTSAFEAGAEYVQSAEDGVANFYFNWGLTGTTQDIYVAPITRNGETR
ncbi:MAG: TolB family protein, partial [bacterium]